MSPGSTFDTVSMCSHVDCQLLGFLRFDFAQSFGDAQYAMPSLMWHKDQRLFVLSKLMLS